MTEQFQHIQLENVIGERFGRYSKYVIQDRAIPDVRDGLKPVQRRILYAMLKEGNTFDKNYRKSAKTVGTVIGNYHPHGESSIYDAMVRLGQDWKMREELVIMHGNKGSIDGDPAAAMRYTEAKLSELSNELLRDIHKETVQFVNNFDDTEVEPTVLPSRFPNILVNGSTGISAGYATDIPPHNLNEVIDATLKMIDKPSLTVDELMKIMPGPDFPTGGIIQGVDEIKKAYETGKGKIVLRSKYTTEDVRGGKTHIIIDELPYDVNKANLVKKIDEIRVDKKIDGIIEVRDETDRTGLRIVIEVRKDANVTGIINYLLKRTDLQITYNFNMVAISKRAPRQLGILDILHSYIDHQKDVVTRRSQYELKMSEKRMHIIEGLMRALSILDEVIKIIRNSENKKNAKDNLVRAYEFTEQQAEAIVTLQLYRLTNTDIADLEQEHNELEYNINYLNEVLNDEKVLLKLIKSELREIKKKYKRERLSVIENEIESIELEKEVLIPSEETIVSVTNDGYIKRTSPRSFSASGVDEVGMKEDDYLLLVSESNTLHHLLTFTNKGKYMIIPVHELQDIKWKDNGQHISTRFRLEPDEKIIVAFTIDQFNTDRSIIMVTKNGQVKRSHLANYEATRIKRPIIGMNLKGDDEIINVMMSSNNENILIITNKGMSLKYNVDSINETGLKSQGVKAISLKEDDFISGAHIVNDNDILITVTQRGAVKKTEVKVLDLGARSQVGQMLYKNIKSKPHRIVQTALYKEGLVATLKSQTQAQQVQLKDIRTSGKHLNGSFVVDENEFNSVEIVIFHVYS